MKRNYKKIIFTILGILILITGLTFTVIGINSMGDFNSNRFSLSFIGLPMIFVGITLIMFTNLRTINTKLAKEVAPAHVEYTKQILNGIRNETVDTANAILNDTIVCPNCNNVNEVDDNYCKECGTKLKATCPNCGKTLDSDSKFCNECGYKL